MITRIRNGQKAGLLEIALFWPQPKFCFKVLALLQKEGYIRGLKKVILKNKESFILINTLLEAEQDCLISGTISINKEIELINHCIKNGKKHIKLIIYGKNSNDEKIYEKYNDYNR